MTGKEKSEAFGNFVNAFGAARLLLQRSHEQDFLIEAVVLYAALIDGFCRMALILKQQLNNKNADIDVSYIYQDDSDKKYYSERNIYKFAYDKNILEKDLLDEINALYDIRNKVIHRFFITDIEYSHLELVLDRYELVFQRLWNIVYGLESEQIRLGIGMAVSRKTGKRHRVKILENIRKKIRTGDSKNLAKTLGTKLIKDLEKFSEKTEKEKVRDDINDEVEIREEKTKIPPGYASVKEVTKWAERNGLLENCDCGHKKIDHIDTSKPKDKDRNLENYVGLCKVEGCTCKNYNITE